MNVFPIKVPALSGRREDIPPLIESFIRKYNDKFGVEKDIDEEAKEYMQNHEWPGNIRELENAIQRLIIGCKGDTITVLDVMRELHGNKMESLSVDFDKEQIDSGEMDLASMVDNFEKNIIKYACEKFGSTRKAAKAINISQTQLVRKKNKYGL